MFCKIVFDSPNYKLIGADLSDLPAFNDILLSVGVDFAKPTLLLSEVVLVYLRPERFVWVLSEFLP